MEIYLRKLILKNIFYILKILFQRKLVPKDFGLR